MTTATRLARRFDASHSCLRPVHDRSTDFDAWLAAFWATGCPPEPDTCPDAVSLLDDHGRRAVRWYELDGNVLGYLPGLRSRCYRVPAGATEPSLDGILDDEGPVCGGDDHRPVDRPDLLIGLVPFAAGDRSFAGRRPAIGLDPHPERVDRSGGDRLPAGDLFHRQAEGDGQVVG
jgi:hypothetical protein